MQIRHVLIKDHIQIFFSETAEPKGTIPATLGLIWFGGFRGEDWTDGRQVMAKAHIAFGQVS
jgi:hypothetical protein